MNGMLKNQWSPSNVPYINFAPPENMLQALYYKCDAASDPKKQGLLSAVGYTNIVNVPQMIESPELTSGLDQGQK